MISYFDRSDLELIQIGTESNCIVIFADRLEDIVLPELRAELEATKQQWLA